MEEVKWPEITKDTPIEEVKRIHQAVWDYVVEHGEKPITPYRMDCICCEYVFIHKNKCNFCPILWPADEFGDRYCCMAHPNIGLYDRWIEAVGGEKIELASQIRDLPWKFENN